MEKTQESVGRKHDLPEAVRLCLAVAVAVALWYLDRWTGYPLPAWEKASVLGLIAYFWVVSKIRREPLHRMLVISVSAAAVVLLILTWRDMGAWIGVLGCMALSPVYPRLKSYRDANTSWPRVVALFAIIVGGSAALLFIVVWLVNR